MNPTVTHTLEPEKRQKTQYGGNIYIYNSVY